MVSLNGKRQGPPSMRRVLMATMRMPQCERRCSAVPLPHHHEQPRLLVSEQCLLGGGTQPVVVVVVVSPLFCVIDWYARASKAAFLGAPYISGDGIDGLYAHELNECVRVFVSLFGCECLFENRISQQKWMVLFG